MEGEMTYEKTLTDPMPWPFISELLNHKYYLVTGTEMEYYFESPNGRWDINWSVEGDEITFFVYPEPDSDEWDKVDGYWDAGPIKSWASVKLPVEVEAYENCEGMEEFLAILNKYSSIINDPDFSVGKRIANSK